MTGYIIIRRDGGPWTGYGWRVTIDADGSRASCLYVDYSKRDAVRKARQDAGVVGRHLKKIEI